MSIYTTIQSQAPSVAAAPEIMALKTSLDSKLDDEKRRSDQVKKAIDAADAEQADSLDINSIANAEKIAKTAEEKSRIARIRARFEEFQQRMVDEDFQALRKELQRFELDLERILGTPLMSIQETELDEIIASVKKLLDRFPRATVPGTKIVNLVAERASSLRESVRKQRREMAEKQTLMVDIRGASTLREFERQLRKFVEPLRLGQTDAAHGRRERPTAIRNRASQQNDVERTSGYRSWPKASDPGTLVSRTSSIRGSEVD